MNLSYGAEEGICQSSLTPTRLQSAIQTSVQNLTPQQSKIWKDVKAIEESFRDFMLKEFGKGKFRVHYLTINEEKLFSRMHFKESELIFVPKTEYSALVQRSKLQLDLSSNHSEDHLYQNNDSVYFLNTIGFSMPISEHQDLIMQFLIPVIYLKNGYMNTKFILPKTLDCFRDLYLVWEVFRYFDQYFGANSLSDVREINPQEIDPLIWEFVSYVGSTLNLRERFATAKKNQFYLCQGPFKSLDITKKQINKEMQSTSRKMPLLENSHVQNLIQDEADKTAKKKGPQERDFRDGLARAKYGSLVCQDTFCRIGFCEDSNIGSLDQGNIAFLGCGLVDPIMISTALNPVRTTKSKRLIYLNDICIEHILFSVYLSNSDMNPPKDDVVSSEFCSYFRIIYGDILKYKPQACSFIAIYAGFLVKYLAETGNFKDFQKLACDSLCMNGSLYIDEILPVSMKNFFNRLAPTDVDQIYDIIQSGYEGFKYTEYPRINYFGYKVTKTTIGPKIILPT